MRKSKLWTGLLSGILALSLAACSAPAQTTENSAVESNAGENAEESNELTVWAWDKAFNIYAMEEAEKIYQKEHPDFKLNIVEVSWDDIQPQLATILSSGDLSQLPDILLMQDFAYAKYVKTYPDLFEDITDSGIDFSEFPEGKLGTLQ